MDEKWVALYDLGQELILLRDARQIAEMVLDIAARLLDCQDSNFWLVDEACQELYVAAARGFLQGSDQRQPLNSKRGIVVSAARTHRKVCVPDVSQDPRYIQWGFQATSELAVPVLIENRVLGVLNVESVHPDAYGDSDQELLSILANQAALALENARLYGEEKRRAQEMVTLNQISQRISQRLDLQATLQAIVDAAAGLIPCALAEVSLWNEQTRMLTLNAMHCTPERTYPLGETFPPGEGYTGWVVRNRQSLLVADVDAFQQVQPYLLPGELPFQAYAGIPMLAGETLVGALVLVADHKGAFTANHMYMLEALSHQAVIAIRNAQLYEETKRQAHKLEVVHAVAEVVNRPGDLDEILAEGLRQTLAVTGLEMGAIALLDPKDKRLFLQSTQGMSVDFVAWLGEHLKVKTLNTETWPEDLDFYVEDLSQAHVQLPKQISEEEFHLYGEIPLFADGALEGVLIVATPSTHSFPAEEKHLLQAIAHQLGMAITNARLRQESLAAERLAAVGRVAASVAHDLRSPLGGILRSAELLGRPELTPATRQKVSQAIISLTRRLINNSQQILDYIQKEHLYLNFTACQLSEFLEGVLAVLEVDFSDRGIEVEKTFRYQEMVCMDGDRMAQVIYNIAANARDAMPRGGKFMVSTRKAGGAVEIRLADTGSGVPSEVGERIFEPFFSYGKRQGAGLGLAIARRIVEEHGGTLRLENWEGAGARFIIHLPA